MFALRGRFEAVKATRMRLMDAGLLASVVVSTSIVYYHLVFTYSSNKMSTANKTLAIFSPKLAFTRVREREREREYFFLLYRSG